MIRPALVGDLAEIDSFDPFAGDRLREIEEHRMLVLYLEKSVVAYASWQPAGFIGRDYVTFLCVAPSHRRQGFAVTLLGSVEAHVGPGRLFISTEEDNAAMLTLLPREGWTYAGEVKGANDGDRAELFFWKDL